MKIKNYIVEYLVNGSDCLDYIDSYNECISDFKASGEYCMQNWLESLVADIEIIDEISCKTSDITNSYYLIFKINSIYYSVYIEPLKRGLEKIFYDTLTQVIPRQKVITVYKPVEKNNYVKIIK